MRRLSRRDADCYSQMLRIIVKSVKKAKGKKATFGQPGRLSYRGLGALANKNRSIWVVFFLGRFGVKGKKGGNGMGNNDRIREIFENYHTIAVYGMSKNPAKAAHSVPAFLLSKGYTIIPVNPSADMILNRRCYHSLKEVEEHIDIIEAFRPPEEAPGIVQEAIERKKAI